MRRKAKRSRASYVRAGRKAARTRARKRRNPTRHRPVVYKFRTKPRLRRAPKWRLGRKIGVKRVNPRRRRRRNPARLFKGANFRQIFSQARLTNAVAILAGVGGSGILKRFTADLMQPGSNMQDWYKRLYGLLSIFVGASLNMRGRQAVTKSAGTGMVVFGLYDLLTSNIEQVRQFLPAISPPTAFRRAPAEAVEGGYRSYGQKTYMGANIGPGGLEIVGSNLDPSQSPEIVGDDMDLADTLDMSA